MTSSQNLIWHAAVLGRWMARILGSLVVLFFLALVFGGGPPNPLALTAEENLSLLAILLLFSGLAVAWRYEGLGGAITILAFAALVLVSRTHVRMPALQIPAVLGALHFVCWLRLRYPAPANAALLHVPRSVVATGCAILGSFLILSANEIFGNPPLMTPSLRPGPALTGTWATDDTAFTVAPDGSVTGTITGAIRNNRSWFGRLMGWRGEYILRGTSGGRPYITVLEPYGSELRSGRTHYRHIQ